MDQRTKLKKINIGSGYSFKEGYLRLDVDKKCKPDILSSANKIPVPECRFDEVYAAHILEHYQSKETFQVLREWSRILVPGGKLVIKVPNVGGASTLVANGKISWHEFKRILFGSDPQANPWMQHKNAFNKQYLERMLYVTGFIDIEFHDTNWEEIHCTARKHSG